MSSHLNSRVPLLGVVSLLFGLLAPAALGQQVADTEFSVQRGFFDLPFSVVITTATPGATIRYTLDGSDPQTSANRLEGPSPMAVSIDPNSTNGGLRVLTPAVTLRAYAFKSGMTSTNVDTQTYVFLGEVLNQTRPSGYPGSVTYHVDSRVVTDPRYSGRILDDLRSIPAMSIVMSRDDMFGSNGVYASVAGTVEKEGSIEVIYPDGSKGEQENCGFRPHSHILSKRSVRLYFRASYGAARFKHALFGDAIEGQESAVDRFDRLVLRAGANDNLQSGFDGRNARATYIADQLARSSQTAMSGYGSRGLFVHLYINGMYWGLYNPVERPDDGFTSDYFGGAKTDWFAINHGGVLSGDPVNFNRVYSGGTQASWPLLQQYVATEAFADYIIYYCFSGGGDWPANNWYAGIRNLPTHGRLRYFVWDCEDSWIRMPGRANDGAWIHPELMSSYTPVGRLWRALDDHAEFRMQFADRVYKQCFNDGALSEASIKARFDALCDEVDGGIVGESARWGRLKYGGGLWTRDDNWVPYRDSVRNLMTGNAQQLVSALRNTSVPSSHPRYYPTIDPPLFKSGTAALQVTRAEVTAGFQLGIHRDGSSGTVYYTTDGTDPRSPGGAVQGTSAGSQTTITIQRPTLVKARTLSGNEWSALHEIRVTVGLPPRIEIHEIAAINTTGITDELGEHEDWIEIFNRHVGVLDLSGYYLTDDPTQLTKWVFPSGSVIQPGGTLIVWADNEPHEGPLHATFRLSGAGETIALVRSNGTTMVDSYTFGGQLADVSIGRFRDVPGQWAMFPAPTPGRVNHPRPCGHLPYLPNSTQPVAFDLEGAGVPTLGDRLSYRIDDAAPGSALAVGLAVRPRHVALGFGTVLIDPMVFLNGVADSTGDASLSMSIPNLNIWRGQVIYSQALFYSGTAIGLSNALITGICE